MIDRQLRKALRATILGLSDAELVYAREEIAREQKRRRLAVRERRRHKASPEQPVGTCASGHNL